MKNYKKLLRAGILTLLTLGLVGCGNSIGSKSDSNLSNINSQFSADEVSKPLVWIFTDMSDKNLKDGGKPVNDPDDISAMAGYALMSNEFNTLGIVVASTHRSEHKTSPDQGEWAKNYIGAAYKADLESLNKNIGGYQSELPFIESSIKKTAKHYDKNETYSSLTNYPAVQALVDAVKAQTTTVNVLIWGSCTEPAIFAKYCESSNNAALLKKVRFIAHWTNSSLHQGTEKEPWNVANCKEDRAACEYLKSLAVAKKCEYYECGAIGQHGIVSGAPSGKTYYDQYKVSKLGKIFAEGKYENDKVDHSDSATYWVLLGNWGVSLSDISSNGSNPKSTEQANETKFKNKSKAIHDELLRRAKAAANLYTPAPSAVPTLKPSVAPVVTPSVVPNSNSIKLETENANYKRGVSVENCNEGGQNITSIDSNDCIGFNNINLTGISQIKARVAAANRDGKIEIRLNSTNGELVGTLEVRKTGGWQNWQTVSTNIKSLSGKNNLYFVFKCSFDEDFLKVNYIELVSTSVVVATATPKQSAAPVVVPSPSKAPVIPSPSKATIVFDTNQTINQYKISSNINNIFIKKGVTVKGSFKIENRSNALTIEGEGETSVLEGIKNTRNYGIEADSNFTLNLKNFKSLNPSYYHMRLIKTKIVADYVWLVDDSGDTQKNADGFSGGDGSTYNHCYVNTWDDSFKIYYGSYTIKNTTIIHNKNGAPFQMGWGDGINDQCNLTLDNVTVISNDKNGYNQGVFSWAGGTKAQTRNIKLEGLGLILKTNSGMKTAPLYMFGSNPNSTKNKTLNISGVNAIASTSSNTVNRNNSTNNKVNLK